MTIGTRRGTAGVTAVLASGLVLVATAACSSSGGPDTAGPNATNQTTPAATSSAAAPSTAPTASATPADAATAAAIKKAYAQFFSGTAAPAVSEQALQHGAAFRQTLVDQAKGQYSKGSGVKVTAMDVRGQVADVTFTLTNGGKPLLSGIKGLAVQEGGSWKVAAITFCGLLKLQGTPPSACSDPSITSLPQ